MLYNPQLKNFIVIADAGSFNKASQSLNISATALVKQIRLLENDLNVQLFQRSYRGLTLTKSGEVLYKEAKKIIQLCNETEETVVNAADSSSFHLRIGTSIMSPVQFLIENETWMQLHQQEPHMEVEFLNFENTPEVAGSVFDNLGKNIDIIAGIYDDLLLKNRGCASTFLSYEPFCISCSSTVPLASKTVLNVEDLYGYELCMMHRDWSSSMDCLRNDLEKNHSQIRITDIDFYDAQIFNTCQKKNALLLTISEWKYANPFMVTLPVNLNHGINYGLLHQKKPSPKVKCLIKAIEDITMNKK